MSGISPGQIPDAGTLETWAGKAANTALEELKEVSAKAAEVLLVSAALSAASTLAPGEKAPPGVILAGVGAIGASCFHDLDSFLRMGIDSLEELRGYSGVLLGTLASVSAAAGSVGSAAAKYAATVFFMDVALTLADRAVIPMVCAFAALSIADAAVGNRVLRMAKNTVKKAAGFLLTGTAMLFTGWITLSGIITETSDVLAAKAAKTAVSTLLPVVGSVLSDAAGALVSAASVLRGSVGVFGLLAVLSVCLRPMVSLGTRYAAYKLSAGACTCISDKRISDLVEDAGACFGMLLGLNGLGVFMVFVSIFSMIRVSL